MRFSQPHIMAAATLLAEHVMTSETRLSLVDEWSRGALLHHGRDRHVERMDSNKALNTSAKRARRMNVDAEMFRSLTAEFFQQLLRSSLKGPITHFEEPKVYYRDSEAHILEITHDSWEFKLALRNLGMSGDVPNIHICLYPDGSLEVANETILNVPYEGQTPFKFKRSPLLPASMRKAGLLDECEYGDDRYYRVAHNMVFGFGKGRVKATVGDWVTCGAKGVQVYTHSQMLKHAGRPVYSV